MTNETNITEQDYTNKTEQDYIELAKESLIKFQEMDNKINKQMENIVESNKIIMNLYTIFKLLDTHIENFELTSLDNDYSDNYLKMLICDGRGISSTFLEYNLFN